jgi:hypothetical protein
MFSGVQTNNNQLEMRYLSGRGGWGGGGYSELALARIRVDICVSSEVMNVFVEGNECVSS